MRGRGPAAHMADFDPVPPSAIVQHGGGDVTREWWRIDPRRRYSRQPAQRFLQRAAYNRECPGFRHVWIASAVSEKFWLKKCYATNLWHNRFYWIREISGWLNLWKPMQCFKENSRFIQQKNSQTPTSTRNWQLDCWILNDIRWNPTFRTESS